MADAEDWDTSENGELPADPYNQSQFAGNATPAAAPAPQAPKEAEAEAEAPAPAPADEDEALPAPAADEEEQAGAAAAPADEAADEAAAAVEEMTLSGGASAEPVIPVRVEPAAVDTSSPPTSPNPSRSTGSRTPPSGRKGSVPADAPEFLKEGHHTGTAFTEKLDPDALKFFNELCEKPFSEQAVAFLNAYWAEVHTQAEFMFSVAWDVMKYADMHSKGVQYIHLYNEGNEMDFNIGLYFYEKLCKRVLDDDEGKKWRDDPQWAPSMPVMLTAIKRKIELREKVDVNFDGKITFLEYLLYQYRDFANPQDFTQRAMKTADLEEHPEIVKARKALEEVNKAIQAYEAEKHRLETESAKPGVKGLGAKHQLAILGASPLAEQLNKSLITAEAAVRIATRKFGNGRVPASATPGEAAAFAKPTDGTVWWMNRDLDEKRRLYGRMGKK